MTKCFYGWFIVVLSGTLGLSTMVAHTTGVNMVVNHLMEDLSITRTQVSIVWVVSLFISASFMPFAGYALDKYGSRKLTIITSIPYTLLVCSMGLIQNWQ
jgi:MFS family permease